MKAIHCLLGCCRRRRWNRLLTIVCMCLVVIQALGCGTNRVRHPSPPPPPIDVSQLPTSGRIKCTEEEHMRPSVPVWELPGISGPPDDSGRNAGIVGHDRGILHGCDEVGVIAFAWSEADSTYYVYVRDAKTEVAGWLEVKFVELPLDPATP